MVEVLFGNLPDPKLIQSLSGEPLDKTPHRDGRGEFAAGPGSWCQLQINAEAVGILRLVSQPA